MNTKVYVSLLLIPLFFISLTPSSAGSQQKPNAYWSSQPSGKFLKDEIFDICSSTSMLGYMGVQAKVDGKQRNDNFIQTMSMSMLQNYQKQHVAIKQRDAALDRKVTDLYLGIANKLYDGALTGGEKSLASLLKKDGSDHFLVGLIGSCYKTLATW